MKKTILLTICILQISLCLFAQSNKKQIPGFFDVYLGDTESEALSKIRRQGFSLMYKNNGVFYFSHPSEKFGDISFDALIITFDKEVCCQIGLGFLNKSLSFIRYEASIAKYLKNFDDVEEKAVHEENKSGDGGFFSSWIISKKYGAYSQEESGDMTFFFVFDDEAYRAKMLN